MTKNAPALILLAILIPLYFLPIIVACIRGLARGSGGVVFVNLFFGWTLIGWLLAFVWASTGRTHADERLEARRHAEMLRALKR
jgi:Superinfection immunity protein